MEELSRPKLPKNIDPFHLLKKYNTLEGLSISKINKDTLIPFIYEKNIILWRDWVYQKLTKYIDPFHLLKKKKCFGGIKYTKLTKYVDLFHLLKKYNTLEGLSTIKLTKYIDPFYLLKKTYNKDYTQSIYRIQNITTDLFIRRTNRWN